MQVEGRLTTRTWMLCELGLPAELMVCVAVKV